MTVSYSYQCAFPSVWKVAMVDQCMCVDRPVEGQLRISSDEALKFEAANPGVSISQAQLELLPLTHLSQLFQSQSATDV